MGIRPQLDLYEQQVLKELGLKYEGLQWCELGCQLHRKSGKPAKKIYEKKGVNHISIDITGYFGSVILNLDNPVPKEFLNRFDVVTNYGTIEHVNNQYQVFKNAHNMCKQKGIMIHGFPKRGTFRNHCRYYYTREFIEEFGEACGYKIYGIKELNFDSNRRRRLLVVAYQKGRKRFIAPTSFVNLPIYDSGDLRATGDYIIKKDEKKRLDRDRAKPRKFSKILPSRRRGIRR